MEYLSLLGIVLGVGIFVFLSFKSVNMFLGTLVATIVVAAFSGLNPYTVITDTYIISFSNYISQYFLLFCLSAVFGRVMEESGCARKIAMALASVTKRSKKNAKFFSVMILPLFYVFLSYSGINGFVVVFTVLAIGRELFREVDAPWILYPYGSGGIQPAMMLGGSLYITNIMAADGFGTGLDSMMGLSIVCALVCFLVLALMLYMDLKKYEKRNEGFLPTGEEILKVSLDSMPDDQLPNLIIAIISMASPVVSIMLFDLPPVLGLLVGTILCVVLNFKKFTSIKKTIGNGIVSSAAPIVNTCGAVGFGAVLKVVPGCNVIFGAIDLLPPLYSAIVVNLVFCAVIGSSSSHMPVVINDIVERFTLAGVSPALGQRLTTMSVCAYMTPHNSGPVNAMTLAKFPIAKASWIYFKTTFFPGIVALAVGIAAYKLGIVS